MDFFQHQDNARRSTGYLTILFTLAVLGLCTAIYFIACIAFHFADTDAKGWWQPQMFMWSVLGTLAPSFLHWLPDLRVEGGASAPEPAAAPAGGDD